MKNTLLIGVLIVGIGAAGLLLLNLNKAPAGEEQGLGSNPPNSAEGAPEGSIHNLPVPTAVAAVRAHVAQKAGVSEGGVLIQTAFEREWSDGCLGLGGPAESCIQMITPGYEVTVMVQGTEQTFRTNADGSVIRQQQ